MNVTVRKSLLEKTLFLARLSRGQTGRDWGERRSKKKSPRFIKRFDSTKVNTYKTNKAQDATFLLLSIPNEYKHNRDTTLRLFLWINDFCLRQNSIFSIQFNNTTNYLHSRFLLHDMTEISGMLSSTNNISSLSLAPLITAHITVLSGSQIFSLEFFFTTSSKPSSLPDLFKFIQLCTEA